MIVRPPQPTLAGYHIVLESALKTGCNHFFAAPSPFQGLFLNTSAKRLQEKYGVFVQAENPETACAMALGASSQGEIPLISGNLDDFWRSQGQLHYFWTQSLPCVYLVLMDSPLENHRPVYYRWRDFLSPGLAAGHRYTSLLPGDLHSISSLTQKAFELAKSHLCPILLLMDPLLFDTVTPLEVPEVPFTPKESHHVQPRSLMDLYEEEQKRKQIEPEFWSRPAQNAKAPHLFALGSIAAHLQNTLPDWGVFAAESLQPFPSKELYSWAKEHPVYVIEYEAPFLYHALKEALPDCNWQPTALPYQAPIQIYLEHTLKEQVLKT